ncbi:MAG: FG-GAP repeat protein [Nitrososphaerales archaeon]
MTSPNVQTNGNFGLSVAISGTTIVVGAPFETVSGLSAAGHAYVM